jgi:hypothetical protein
MLVYLENAVATFCGAIQNKVSLALIADEDGFDVPSCRRKRPRRKCGEQAGKQIVPRKPVSRPMSTLPKGGCERTTGLEV